MSYSVENGPDGLPRCWWCLGAPEYLDYHDNEWGRPNHDDTYLFEMLTLESFQSGLSWLTILRKRDGFRKAFAGWDTHRIATFDDGDIARLLADPGIVRHRGKIEAAIANARATVEFDRPLSDVLWDFAPDAGLTAPIAGDELASATRESTAMAKALKQLGFRFLGPTTAYSLMQTAGLVNDHLAGCAFRDP